MYVIIGLDDDVIVDICNEMVIVIGDVVVLVNYNLFG